MRRGKTQEINFEKEHGVKNGDLENTPWHSNLPIDLACEQNQIETIRELTAQRTIVKRQVKKLESKKEDLNI